MINQATIRFTHPSLIGNSNFRRGKKSKDRNFTYTSNAEFQTLCLAYTMDVRYQSIQTIESPMTIKKTVEFANVNGKALEDIRNFIINEDYPSIDSNTKMITSSLVNMIVGKYDYEYSRIAPSIEGGIAIVYSNRKLKGILRKKIYQEVFIEVYNDYSIVGVYSENYKTKDVVEANDIDESENIIKMLENFN